MKDDRTEEQKYQAWLDTCNKVWVKGWQHSYGWVFYSPSGGKHDLSAANLDRLDEIESKSLFVA